MFFVFSAKRTIVRQIVDEKQPLTLLHTPQLHPRKRRAGVACTSPPIQWMHTRKHEKARSELRVGLTWAKSWRMSLWHLSCSPWSRTSGSCDWGASPSCSAPPATAQATAVLWHRTGRSGVCTAARCRSSRCDLCGISFDTLEKTLGNIKQQVSTNSWILRGKWRLDKYRQQRREHTYVYIHRQVGAWTCATWVWDRPHRWWACDRRC